MSKPPFDMGHELEVDRLMSLSEEELIAEYQKEKSNGMADPSWNLKVQVPADSTPEEKQKIEARAAKSESEEEMSRASLAAGSPMRAAMTTSVWSTNYEGRGALDAGSTFLAMVDSVKRLQKDNLRQVESILLTQAITLDAIFNRLATRASQNLDDHLPAAELYLRLAFKAQSQSRATLETLALVKNPKQVAFVKQQNVAQNQQVNNRTRGKKRKNPQNKLLESISTHGQRLDTPASALTKLAHQEMATVDSVNRTQDAGGKGDRLPQRREIGRDTRDAQNIPGGNRRDGGKPE